MKISSVDSSCVKITDQFWKKQIELVQKVTIDACFKKCEETGRIDNFRIAAEKMDGQFKGLWYDDSDVFKIMEGAAYTLGQIDNPKLREYMDTLIDYIYDAQLEDGYINTYHTLKEPEQRWTNMDSHEMYNGGHMIEAACAYHQVTKTRKFLDVAIKFADHLYERFYKKINWVPGHQEIELALVKLFEVTNDEKYLDLSKWLLDNRGKGYGSKGNGDKWDKAYYQDEVHVSKLKKISGHAVRAMYMLTAMADISKYRQTDYYESLQSVWENVCHKNMYVTGGIGSSKDNEGFTKDYDLPNYEAYCETCASVGMVMFNHRMFKYKRDAKYINVLERAMYNGSIAGLSQSGDLFFYVNPLSADDHHRKKWYSTSCCPTQLCRFIPSVGNYIYAYDEESIYVNLFVQNSADVEGVKINMITDYPKCGKVHIDLSQKKTLKIRVPNYVSDFKVSCQFCIEDGYIKVEDVKEVDVDFTFSVVKITTDLVDEDKDKVAIGYGPFVYCVEDIDSKIPIDDICISNDTLFNITEFENLPALDVYNSEFVCTMIPYYLWNNRENSKMRVWLDYKNTLYKY